ncbi:hypothetical protein G6F58_012921 [Rhizopus delemar]|nr:hypothetical protein G6F58_012921 [Rhizopus delemar]
MQLTGFEGRVALVTGAAGGIGEALVRFLAAAGCTVVATDREAPRVDDAGVHAFSLDVTDSVAVDALVDRVEASLGPIGLAASVAGVLHVGEVAGTTDADWRRVFSVNADGVVRLSLSVRMRRACRGMAWPPMRHPRLPPRCSPVALGWSWRRSVSAATSSPRVQH